MHMTRLLVASFLATRFLAEKGVDMLLNTVQKQ